MHADAAELCAIRRRCRRRRRSPTTSGGKHRQRKAKVKSLEAREGSGEPPGRRVYLRCCSEQANDARMIGALRRKWRALLERPRSSAEASACSWDQHGASWTERERLRSVGPGGGLCCPTLGAEGSSGGSGALEGLGRLGITRADSQDARGTLRSGCGGL